MINELILMNGYGLYVWSAFFFTLLSFASLYFVIKLQYLKEQNKFASKFSSLDSKKAKFAERQSINKEILSNASNI
tara:strand:- start:4008 stop:4235 length:228 start_codon:yes stop_codon:yes gene_type:complete